MPDQPPPQRGWGGARSNAGRAPRHTIRGIDAEHMGYLREIVLERRKQPGMSRYTYAQAVEDLIIQEMWRRRREGAEEIQ